MDGVFLLFLGIFYFLSFIYNTLHTVNRPFMFRGGWAIHKSLKKGNFLSKFWAVMLGMRFD